MAISNHFYNCTAYYTQSRFFNDLLDNIKYSIPVFHQFRVRHGKRYLRIEYQKFENGVWHHYCWVDTISNVIVPNRNSRTHAPIRNGSQRYLKYLGPARMKYDKELSQ